MAKEKLSFKNGMRFCYRVKEINLKDFYNKIIEIATNNGEDDFIIELKIDYLINKKVDINDIVNCINQVKKDLSEKYDIEKQFIITLRNFKSGGNCLISDKEYASIIDTVYNKAKVDALDIDYDFYENNTSFVKKLFDGKKTLIITYCILDKSLTQDEYDDIFKKMIKTPAYVVKIVTHAFSTLDADRLMDTAKNYKDTFEKNNKVSVVISTGKLGILSRLMYEYTDTKIIYLDTYDLDMVPAGEINKEIFYKYRKLLKNNK